MKSPRYLFSKLKKTLHTITSIDEKLDQVKINQGLILSEMNRNKLSNNIKDYEFKVFSQWGEDGIIQHLLDILDIKNKTFIEFGVEDFFESNCRFLLMNNNWSGLVIDGSKDNIEILKNSYFYWKYDLKAIAGFITKYNINEILNDSGFDQDIGILSIDLDGNDYYVLELINFYKPRILICEYNSVYGALRSISIPYQDDFERTQKHYSNLYFGASLGAMTYLANKKGYSLVGTNSASNNAFYVRNDLLNDKLEVLSAEQAFVPSKIREGRDAHGALTYVAGDDRINVIQGMPVLNVITNEIERL